MKRILAVVTLSLALAGVSYASSEDKVLSAMNGNVKFSHKKHADAKVACTSCHETDKGGKIAALGSKPTNKEWAHKTCKACHETGKKGPTKCGECHKK